MKLSLALSICFILISASTALSQKYIVKDIKSFGAKGDGRTNDHGAFQKAAAFFNKRGGNGILNISKGTYIIGKQNFSAGNPNKPAYEGEDVLHFKKIKNLKIRGTVNSVLKYKEGLRFGSFDPLTGLPYLHDDPLFRSYVHAAFAGSCIEFDSCSDVSVTNLIMDGNNKGLILGGAWGDVGRQLTHYGIFIHNSNNVLIDRLNVHHFGLDGICVANIISRQKDSITLLNSSFAYNARQGLSWVGGNQLVAKGCQFNHTGKGAFSSAPTAGVDIEAEVGPVKNGDFTNCEFIDNKGVGIAATTGDDADCTFTNCTIWGITNWSIWVTKPGFTFNTCKVYGAIIHGYNSPDEKNATKFINCVFEDKAYNGKEPYGNHLIESNHVKRMSFINCTFIANKKKLCWVSIDPKTKPEEKYQFLNCSFIIKNTAGTNGDLIGLISGMVLKNCTFEFQNPRDRMRGLNLIDYKGGRNIDLGGNKIRFAGKTMITRPF